MAALMPAEQSAVLVSDAQAGDQQARFESSRIEFPQLEEPPVEVIRTVAVAGTAQADPLGAAVATDMTAYTAPAPSVRATWLGDLALLPEPIAAAPIAVAAAQEAPVVPTAGETMRVGATALNVRAAPTTDGAKMFALAANQDVVVTEHSGEWAFIVTPDGQSGWVYASYLRDPSEVQPAVEAEPRVRVAVARSEEPRRAAPEAKVVRVASAEPEAEPERRRRDFAVLGDSVALRASPSRHSERLFVLPAGERVAIAETRGRWHYVVAQTGEAGWVQAR